MKRRVQIILCGLLVFCAGLIFASCGKQNFDTNKIVITNTSYTYDGNAHIFTVSYEDLETTITYSLDNQTFVNGEELNIKEIGTYTIYYKLTADNYNDYVGNATLEIKSKQFTSEQISIEDDTVDYDGQTHMFIVKVAGINPTVKFSDDGINFDYAYRLLKKNAGTYKVYYKISADGYEDYTSYATLTINKINFDETQISVSRKSQTYSGFYTMFEINYPEKISILYSLDGNDFKTLDKINIKDPGSYEIYYKISNPNYNDYTSKATLTIKKDKLTNDLFTISNGTYNYDGNKHMLSITSNISGFNVTYSLDGNDYVDADELNIVDAGEYTIYFKIKSEFYEDYNGHTYLTINKSSLSENIINIGSTTLTYNGQKQIVPITVNDLNATVTYSLDNYNYSATPYLKDVGEYKLYYKIESKNYNTYSGSIDVLITGVKIETYSICFADIETALEYDNLTEDTILAIYGDAVLNNTLYITKTITLDGKNKYSIKASDNFTDGNLIKVSTTNTTTLTLKDITVNANQKSRVICVNNSNKLQILNATITGGYLETSYAPGVFITDKASFTMVGGSITGNNVSENYEHKDKYYVAYSLDLWIGANASGTGVEYQISKGYVGKMYINANDYSAKNPGKFTLIGGTIDSIYLEYDANYGAKLEYQNGTIGKLLISTKTSGSYKEVTPVSGTTYKGGIDD